MERDVAILVWKYRKSENFWHNLFEKAIVYFTGYDYVHTALWIDGYRYDAARWRANGKWRTGIRRVRTSRSADVVLLPANQLSKMKKTLIKSIADTYYKMRRPYNYFKVVALIIIWPTRWIWKKLGWVPFDRDLRGEICSVFVDEVFKRAGIDLFPDDHEGYTVPGMFVEKLPDNGWKEF